MDYSREHGDLVFHGCADSYFETHSVHLFDLRGHGRSERVSSGYDTKTMGADLEALVSLNGETPIDLVGHSYGALVALHFTLRYPDKVRRLALVELPLPPSRIEDMQTFLRLAPADMVNALPEPLKVLIHQNGGRRRARRFLDNLSFLSQSCSLLEDLQREEDLSHEELAGIQCPVLGLFGRDSSCDQVSERLNHSMPLYRQEILPGGHYLPLDAGPAVTECLKGFLRG